MKKIIIIGLCISLLLLGGCSTLSEKACKGLDGDLIDRNRCIIGESNSTYNYIFVCGSDSISVYSDKNIEEMNLHWSIRLRCNYAKIVNKV